MNPMTPFVESPTGRLTELVYLLADKPLTLVHHAVLDAEEDLGGQSGSIDPWLIAASAMERLTTLTEASLASRRSEARTPELQLELV